MPELPEVETVVRGLAPVLVGRAIARAEVRREGLRFPFPTNFATRLKGRRMVTVRRLAKYILIDLDGDETLITHLGMTGRFTVLEGDGDRRNLGAFYFEADANGDAAGPHDHVVFHLDDGPRVVFTDPRRFGLMDLAHTARLGEHRLLCRLGIDPLGNELSGAWLNRALKGRRTTIKAALMDQRLIAGLGNIYACEALHRAGISPRRSAGALVTGRGVGVRLERLAGAVVTVLKEAIAAGGSTISDFAGSSGQAGGFQQRFRVYDREGERCCRPGCGGVIRRIVQCGRSSFHCPRCQR